MKKIDNPKTKKTNKKLNEWKLIRKAKYLYEYKKYIHTCNIKYKNKYIESIIIRCYKISKV